MYSVTSKLSSLLDETLTWESADAWARDHGLDVITLAETVPGLQHINLDLLEDGRTVVRTATYDSVQSRLDHVNSGGTLPSLRRPGYFSVTFVEETEPTPAASFSA
jgi:hypothetical protein